MQHRRCSCSIYSPKTCQNKRPQHSVQSSFFKKWVVSCQGDVTKISLVKQLHSRTSICSCLLMFFWLLRSEMLVPFSSHKDVCVSFPFIKFPYRVVMFKNSTNFAGSSVASTYIDHRMSPLKMVTSQAQEVQELENAMAQIVAYASCLLGIRVLQWCSDIGTTQRVGHCHRFQCSS